MKEYDVRPASENATLFSVGSLYRPLSDVPVSPEAVLAAEWMGLVLDHKVVRAPLSEEGSRPGLGLGLFGLDADAIAAAVLIDLVSDPRFCLRDPSHGRSAYGSSFKNMSPERVLYWASANRWANRVKAGFEDATFARDSYILSDWDAGAPVFLWLKGIDRVEWTDWVTRQFIGLVEDRKDLGLPTVLSCRSAFSTFRAYAPPRITEFLREAALLP